jgi:nicotinamide phosphoribosyltransferase
MNNIILATDSYKINHWNQYPVDTQAVYSYFEARPGARFPSTVFVGLQHILKEYMEGRVVTMEDVEQADALATAHFGGEGLFNREGWEHVVNDHDGKLPLKIKAVPEGTVVPINNVMMTVENTCPKCFWLTNAMESLLTHVWYPSTVATLSRHTKRVIASYLDMTAESRDGLPFMLHDFGYRGATSPESAAIGGFGHLANFKGTDTLPAMLLAMKYYDAKLDDLAFSVPATEHSVMTAKGEEGEFTVVEQLLDNYPTGILSVVADSYDIYRFVDTIGTTYKDRILERDGVFVVRPDSITPEHKTPQALTVNLVRRLDAHFGSTPNTKGYKVLNPKVRILWGDGIDPLGIDLILHELECAGYSAENMVFGMGGGLLQKDINRDTQRFAFKCAAAKRENEWVDVFKKPLDESKASKKGRLKLVRNGELKTVPIIHGGDDVMQTVFLNGEVVKTYTMDEVRANAEL